jgi:hypothetical protein
LQTHAEQYRQRVKEAGFIIERDYHIPDEVGGEHQMLILRKRIVQGEWGRNMKQGWNAMFLIKNMSSQ